MLWTLRQAGFNLGRSSILDRLNSYAEISPSGTGLRIFWFAKLPPKDRKLGGFECYESGRYLTVTGNHLPGTR